MSLKGLDLVKLSKLTSDYTDELKCLECCKYYIAPATAACGHSLCHTCWRGRRTCPVCATSLDRKTLKLNLPLQALTNHIQTLGEAFEKLFNLKLDEFSLDTEGLEAEKDPDKNVKEWLTSTQNQFSAPIQNSEPFSQELLPPNLIEISASNIIIHTDGKKPISPVKVTKVMHVPPPQDDWDKIEAMPESEDVPKSSENIVGPMDIEPFILDDNEYTTDHPRRSARKRDTKHDDSNQKTSDVASHKHNSRDSSCENDKKSQKSKQTWNNVKRMRKEFSKLNKKNRNKLNVSIEMVKKTQNVKPVSNTPLVATPQIMNIDDNTPNKENEIVNTPNDSIDNEQNANNGVNILENANVNNSIKLCVDPTSGNILVSNDNNIKNKYVSNTVKKTDATDIASSNKSQNDLKENTKMSFIKKSALCPNNVKVINDNVPSVSVPQTVSDNSDDIEISIKIGNTITNILIKKKSDVQVKINSDREVQTSLGPYGLASNEPSAAYKKLPNIDINIASSGSNNPVSQINASRSRITETTTNKVDKSISEKKNTASADTGTAQFEITESVEKELSNVMEYETAEENKNAPNNVDIITKSQTQYMAKNNENLDDSNDLDIFNSGSVKEANVQTLEEHAPSEILVSTVCSKLKSQRNRGKRNREQSEEDTLPTNKKAKVKSQLKDKEECLQPDSEPNYDLIMGQVFANIDADMEDIRIDQDTQNTKHDNDEPKQLQNKNVSQVYKTQTIKAVNQMNTQTTATLVQEGYNEKHSENVFSILEKDEEIPDSTNSNKVAQQVEDLLTPVLCRHLASSQESQGKTNKSNKISQDYDDSDRSVVEETPQKNISIPKLKRSSTSNQSQTTLSETKRIPLKESAQVQSIINLTDTVSESNKSNRDVTVIDNASKKLTLETPLTITKFADHIIHKSTPMARKSLNFDNENDDDDPEQTLCPTVDVIAKTTQEKEFMSKAFERTPTTPQARPLMARNNLSKANRKFCLAGSCLTSSEIANVKILCTQRKWSYVEKYTKDITHLVVGVDEEKKSQRSVKYMCALAASKWIVSFDWIKTCLQSKEVVDEEYFEALDSTGEPGPRRSRTAKQKLFQGIKFYCMPPFSILDVDTLKSMLVAAGGRVLKDIKEVKVSEGSSQPALLLAEPEHTQEDRFIYLAMEQSIVPVNHEWVLNCLGSYALCSIQDLLLCPSSLLPAATARWPEVLLAQDYE